MVLAKCQYKGCCKIMHLCFLFFFRWIVFLALSANINYWNRQIFFKSDHLRLTFWVVTSSKACNWVYFCSLSEEIILVYIIFLFLVYFSCLCWYFKIDSFSLYTARVFDTSNSYSIDNGYRFAELKKFHGIEDVKAPIGGAGPQKMSSGLICTVLELLKFPLLTQDMHILLHWHLPLQPSPWSVWELQLVKKHPWQKSCLQPQRW